MLLINSPDYKEVNDEYVRLKTEKKVTGREKNISRFSLFNGPANVQHLAEHLRLGGMYDIFYRGWSNTVHGIDIMRGMITANEKNEFQLTQIRLPYDADSVTYSCYLVVLMGFKEIIDKRLSEREAEFKNFFDKKQDFFLDLLKPKFVEQR